MWSGVLGMGRAKLAAVVRRAARPRGLRLRLALAFCAASMLTAPGGVADHATAADGAGGTSKTTVNSAENAPADAADDLPPQLKAAQENALKWWRDPANQLTMVESTNTDEYGQRLRTIVFILRDANGRSLAVSRAGSTEMKVFFQQRLDKLLRQASQQHGLSQSQIDKLQLAAEVDIARFNRRVQEAVQRMNHSSNRTADNGPAAQNNAGVVNGPALDHPAAANPAPDNPAPDNPAPGNPAEDLATVKGQLAGIAQRCEQGLFDDQSLYTRVLSTLVD